jgi:Holliday junction resolvase
LIVLWSASFGEYCRFSTKENMKKKTDLNQKEIVAVLKQVGADVLDLSAVGGGCPDLVVAWRGENVFVEVKNPKT